MTDRSRLEEGLAAVERRLTGGEAGADLLAERAGLLAELGRTDEAKAQYLAILAVDPGHFTTLNNFGVLLHQARFRTAAKTLFSQAIARRPNQPLGYVNLANLLMYEDELEAAKAHLETALGLDPAHAGAHQRLSGVLHDLGDWDGMQRHRRLGFSPTPVQVRPYFGVSPPVRVLVLTSLPAADLNWPDLIDTDRCAVTTIAAAFLGPSEPLPPHDLIFNAIGDADIAQPDLLAAKAIVGGSGAPVVNDPDRVLRTGRLAVAERLADLPGVRSPKAASLRRSDLVHGGFQTIEGAGIGFPLLLRSPGFHMGRHFARVARPEDLAAAARQLPGGDLMAFQQLDTRNADGLHRKYRVMLIDGRLYPLHLAASKDWKVHYATSAMEADAELRAEEDRFLANMATVLGEVAMKALAAIAGRLDLDYAGVDFGLGPAGELLLFEANAVMTIAPPGEDPKWDYRRPAIEAASAAAREMLVRRGLGYRDTDARKARPSGPVELSTRRPVN